VGGIYTLACGRRLIICLQTPMINGVHIRAAGPLPSGVGGPTRSRAGG
jgi:hypothetical protein